MRANENAMKYKIFGVVFLVLLQLMAILVLAGSELQTKENQLAIEKWDSAQFYPLTDQEMQSPDSWKITEVILRLKTFRRDLKSDL